jgi:hypothetical protein
LGDPEGRFLLGPQLDKAMKGLRKEAEARGRRTFTCLLILPDDQILYTSLTAPTDDPELTTFRIEEGLEGMTPYAVSELVYDWRAIETDRVKLAVVARETLDEARGFADGHGFTAAGFAAMPPQERFPGVPLFDLAEAPRGCPSPMRDRLRPRHVRPGAGGRGPRDDAASSTKRPRRPSRPTMWNGDEAGERHARRTRGGGNRRRGPRPRSSRKKRRPRRPPMPEPDPEPAPEPEPDPEESALADAADRDPEEVIAATAEAPPPSNPRRRTTPPGTPFPISCRGPPLEDRALTEPVAPIADSSDGGETEPSDAVRAARNASAALDSGPPEFSARGAPVPARDADDMSEPGDPAGVRPAR